jgi:class 3 adenylate cyclase/tetratricopeptide (TPR) repeat protein
MERKVVTVLFCDLVGFTQRAEEMDPEDIAAMLAPYHARLKEELERYGGTVEKFIGDAVMALFGAPTAHDDDAERAVRSALAIRDFAKQEGIELRIGITTGEALVDIAARPEAGETMATGDVVNTADRVQAAAPVNGVLVSEQTYAATKEAITYRETVPVEAKGKARPVTVWVAETAAPQTERAHTTPLVGRAEELELLRPVLARAGTERTVQLVTLVGAPGIGKSRLVHELTRGDGRFAWRKGRCLPYGDGVTFWALGEVVKSQLGILETDGPDEAERKLLAGVDDPWIAENLRALVGLGEPRRGVGDRRAEAFAAWREFLAGLAEEQPLAIVLEDLHWADDALLDFVTHVFEWSRDTPLLLICTARPDLLDRRPGWGANQPRALIVPLAPLSDEETAELFTALVGGHAGDELLARAGGNPLYAEQYARLVAEHGSLDELPASVRGIIAARLDTLSELDKELVHDAAVVGRVFWSGAVASLSGTDRWSVEERLLGLERRELVRRKQVSSVEGETEYAFRHVLMRDVAYGEIPRAARAEKHNLAADWIEGLGRADDHAEMLAHHYVSALDYAAAAGQETARLAARARVALRDAGDRALALNAFAAAERHYQPAIELWPEDDAERPALLLRLGKARYYADMKGADVLADAERLLLDAGDRESAAQAAVFLANLAHQSGEPHETVFEHLHRAQAFVEGLQASYTMIDVLVDLAVYLRLAGQHEQGIRLANRALADAEALELPELEARALAIIGMSRGASGDPGGRIDLERSIAITEEIDSPLASHHCGMLADLECSHGNLVRCFELQARARRHAERFGHSAHIQWLKAELVAECYWTGRWDEGLSLADEFLADAEAGSGHFMEGYCRDVRARIRLARGDLEGALDDSARALDQARASDEPQMLCPAFAVRARVLSATDALAEARQVVRELVALWATKSNLFPASAWVVDLAFTLDSLDQLDELRKTAESVRAPTMWLDAANAFAVGDLAIAADLLVEIGSRPDEALVRLRSAQGLAEVRFVAEADRELERALSFFSEVEASAYLRDAHAPSRSRSHRL